MTKYACEICGAKDGVRLLFDAHPDTPAYRLYYDLCTECSTRVQAVIANYLHGRQNTHKTAFLDGIGGHDE